MPDYSIVRFVPDSIAGEFVNVAVVVKVDGRNVIVGTLDCWDRAQEFAGDVSFAQKFCDEVFDMSPEDLSWFPENASGVIQMTPWLPSLEEPVALMTRLKRRCLKDADHA